MLKEYELMRLQNGSDIRGVATAGTENEPVTLLPEAVNLITSAFVRFLAAKYAKEPTDLKIAVGHDSRISAASLQQETYKAISAAGAAAFDCGLASTPAMFMSLIFPAAKMDGAIMITASHLPSNRNGLKFFTTDGGLEKTDILSILKTAASLPALEHTLCVSKLPLMQLYTAHLRQKICTGLSCPENSLPLAGLHIVVDAGNGSGGFFVKDVLQPLGADTSGSLYLEPDGMFPNHIPNPENKAAMQAIQTAVLTNKADLGLIFDTDVDRMSAVLSDGSDISRNGLIALTAAILASDYPGSTIVTDSVTSDELTDFLTQRLHLRHHRYMRGYKNVIDECIRLNEKGELSPLAIETSGHGALKENYYLDDGAYLAIKFIIAAAKAKKAKHLLSELIADWKQPAESRAYRLQIKASSDCQLYGQKILEAVRQKAAQQKINEAMPSYEGIRLIFPEGWALLRLSLHDPNLPLNIESPQKGGAAKIAARMRNLVAGFDFLDISPLND